MKLKEPSITLQFHTGKSKIQTKQTTIIAVCLMNHPNQQRGCTIDTDGIT